MAQLPKSFRGLSFLILLGIIILELPVTAYAQQTASTSSLLEALVKSQTEEYIPFSDTFVRETPGNSRQQKEVVQKAVTSLTKTHLSTTSINKRLPIHVRQLIKKTFQSKESIPLMIENDDADNVSVEVFNVDGEKIDVPVYQLNVSEPAILSIAPPSHFIPGRYRLKITDSQGTVTTQDFTWGVLAINTWGVLAINTNK
jgi:hypothetical protein